jgi:hypothetical protein
MPVLQPETRHARRAQDIANLTRQPWVLMTHIVGRTDLRRAIARNECLSVLERSPCLERKTR